MSGLSPQGGAKRTFDQAAHRHHPHGAERGHHRDMQQLQEESANPEGVAFKQRKRTSDMPVQTAASRLPLSLDAHEQLLLDPFVGPIVMRCR